MSQTDAAAYAQAFPDLFRRAAERARRVVGNDAEAEEIAQETMVRAYASWAEIFEYAVPWVIRVATNLAITRLRARRPHTQTTRSSEPQTTERLDISRALAELPDRQREVVVLRYLADRSEEETAAELGLSVGAVKSHLHRATTTLRSRSDLAEGYRKDYVRWRTQRALRELQQTYALDAAEPAGGWPPPPWDLAHLVEPDGRVRVRAVDREYQPILDADGGEVVTGIMFGYRLCKPPVPDIGVLEATTEIGEALDSEAQLAIERAFELAAQFGRTALDDVSVALALAERLPDPSPLSLPILKQGAGLLHDGPHADARLVLVDERGRAGWTRPQRGDLRPLFVSPSVSRAARHAAREAARRAEQATCADLLGALLLPREHDLAPLPSFVLEVMVYGAEGRYPTRLEDLDATVHGFREPFTSRAEFVDALFS